MSRSIVKLTALLIAIVTSNHTFAQMRNAYLYMQAGGGWGSYNTLNIGATVMYKKFAFTYDYIDQNHRASNVPADYGAGLVIFGDGVPRVTLQGSCLEAARVIYFANNRLRFLARGGLFFGTYHYPDHFTKVSPGWFDSNYRIDWANKDAIGLTIHPTIEWPGAVPFGVSAGLRIVITSVASSAAMDFNVLLGKVRKSRRHENKLSAEN